MDSKVQVWIERNERFRVPADGTRDIIMVGPGTGVAPAGVALVALAAAPAAEWAVIATTFSLNAIGLTVLSRDGRTLCGLS